VSRNGWRLSRRDAGGLLPGGIAVRARYGMGKKLRVGILFGGKSAEHEVSLQSARNVVESLNQERYKVVLIGIDKHGRWLLNEDSRFLLNEDSPKHIKLASSHERVALLPGEHENRLVKLEDKQKALSLDVVFPILHGPFGEDGTVQGLLKLADVPFVGAGVLGSAIGMDKDVMKRLMREAGLPIARFLVMNRGHRALYRDIVEQLGLPLFVKPANLGSSVGISKVTGEEEFLKALNEALAYDTKALIEEAIGGRELECSVLGNEEPIASLPGEVIPQAEFYSYEAKYLDENGAVFEIPARLDRKTVEKIQGLAVRAFKVLCCEGMARVDFFLTPENRLVVNEINTIPGFTRISMYPKLWEASGVSYPELLDRLIQLAFERYEREKLLKTSLTNG
jgi:D-alanine-D-alanine ligase